MKVEIVGEQLRVQADTAWEDYALRAWCAKNTLPNEDGTTKLKDNGLRIDVWPDFNWAKGDKPT